MVDVSAKPDTERVAVAEGHVVMTGKTLDLIVKGNAAKGDDRAKIEAAVAAGASAMPVKLPAPSAGTAAQAGPEGSVLAPEPELMASGMRTESMMNTVALAVCTLAQTTAA